MLEIAITQVFVVHKTNAVKINLTDFKVAVDYLTYIPAAEVRILINFVPDKKGKKCTDKKIRIK